MDLCILSQLISLVKERELDLGVAFDGDADRSLFVTPSGRVFDGDFVLFVLALHFHGRQQLTANKVVGTIMSNYALERTLNERGIEFLRASVGDRYVLEMMKESGANLGGEPSGHVILLDYHTAGDGILTAVKLAEVLARKWGDTGRTRRWIPSLPSSSRWSEGSQEDSTREPCDCWIDSRCGEALWRSRDD